jgi:hypothetical protein
MKKYLILSTAILSLTLIFHSAFAQDNPLFRHISPDANAAYHINLPVILSKVSLADMITRIPPAKHGNDKSRELMDFLKDPTWTGVNINQDILITSLSADFVDSPSYMTVILHLADSSKFRKSMRKEAQGLRITRHSDKSFWGYYDKTAMVWNNELAVIVIVSPPLKNALADAAAMGKIDDSKKEPGTAQTPVSPKYGAMAMPRALATFKGWDSSPIADDPDFKTAFSDNSDFQMYTSKTNYIKAFTKILPHALLGGLTLDSLDMYKHSITTLRFENGRILMQSTTELLPNVAAEMEKFPAPPTDEGLLAGLPKDQLLAFIDLRLNLRVIGYMLDRIGLRRKVDSNLAQKQLSMDDLYHAFKGNLLLAVLAPSHTDSFQRPKPAVYAIIPVGDPIALNKLAEVLKTAKDSTGNDSTGKKPSKIGMFKDKYVLKNNLLVLSDSKASADGYFTNTEKRGNDALTDAVKENPTYLWVDIHTIINLFLGPARPDDGADKKTRMMNGLHLLDKLIAKKSGLHDGKISSSFEITVTKKDQNVLKTIFDLIPASKP